MKTSVLLADSLAGFNNFGQQPAVNKEAFSTIASEELNSVGNHQNNLKWACPTWMWR